MRLFWPLRERSPSTDSECSTASQSSLASDASFYSAAGEAEMETDVAPSLPGETGVVSSRSAPSRPGDPILDLTVDPLADPLGDPLADPPADPPPLTSFPFGVVGAVENGCPRAVGVATPSLPLPPTGVATSGTGPQPATPIAPRRAAAPAFSGENARDAPSSSPAPVFGVQAPSARADAQRTSPPPRPPPPFRAVSRPMPLETTEARAAADRAPSPPTRAAPAPTSDAAIGHAEAPRPSLDASLSLRAPLAAPFPLCARPERGESLADGRALSGYLERDEVPAPAPPSSPRDLSAPPSGSTQDVALAVYAHNAALFECTLCAHTARDLAALQQHRRSAHRSVRFVDHFHSGCACGVSFHSRAAATKHARECPESAFSVAAAARTAAANTAGMSLGADERDHLASVGALHDVASPAFGNILPVAFATAADASSATVIADAAMQHSAVPSAAAQSPRRAHVPPVPRATTTPSALRIGGKRRRLNDDGDNENSDGRDADIEMRADDTDAPAPTNPATSAAATPARTAPAPTDAATARRRHTRWGPRVLVNVARLPRRTHTRWGPALRRDHQHAANMENSNQLLVAATDNAAMARNASATPSATSAPTSATATATATATTPTATATATTATTRRRRSRRPRATATTTTSAPTTTTTTTTSATTATPATTTRATPASATTTATTRAKAPAPATTATATAPTATPSDATWTLRFDGACRRNPGPGGAGAALFNPDGAVVWTCVHYMPGTETNNTAEYTAMLTGVESAAQHGVTSLRVDGDSHLVLSQVRGTFACANKRLRGLRNRVRAALRRFECTRLVHIDRQANAHADRLANRALDTKRTKTQCAQHCEGDERCCHPERPLASRSERPAAERQSSDHDDCDHDVDMEADEADAATAARNDGELFPAVPLSADAFPARQPRLRLRQLSDEEFDAAAATVEQMARIWACRIDDAPDWETGEGYIQALPTQLRIALQQYSVPPPVQPSVRRARAPPKPARPPRTAHDHREQRLDEALDDLAAVQQCAEPDRQQIKKARRRVARIRAALETQHVRQQFGTRERECVEAILARAHPDATEPSPATCPLSSERLQQHFTGTCTPATAFDYGTAEGAKFRDSIRPSAATEEQEIDALVDAPTVDEVEDQLKRAKAATSPGHDGIGYDVLKRFATQIAPMLAAAFAFCWRHQRVPAVWKVGNVRLIHKKGDVADPSNWRPICLQPTVYKLYTGLLAQRLSRWLEANGRLPMTQKGFRPFNGCHENNFVSTTLLDQTRRLHRKLYLVWYDLRDAFGSLPQQLMWSVLADMGAAPEFVQRCRTLYADASFTITNAADGTTQPIRREVGVFQGCPLSPLLFITALAPLQRVLERLDGVGVALADGVRPCSAAYADDIKVFCDSADGIRRCHDAVTQFLSWTGLRANPKKCAALGVTTNARGNPVLDKTLQLAVDDEAIPTLGLHESYAYLGVGDGFDHVRHRLQLEPKLKQLKLEAVALLRSELAPWQILKALKVYIYPKVEYALRHLRPLRSQLEGFDRAVSRGVRHLLHLPPTATTEILYSPTSSGGLGLLPLVEMHQALQVAHAWQMLHSKDLAIRAIAREQVVQICRTRHTLDVEHWRDGERREEMVQLFLNSKLADSPHAPSKRRNGDIGSLWVDVQRHLRTWELALDARHDNGTTELLQLKVPHHRKWLSHKTVLRHLKLHLKLRHLERWRSMTDQGRTVRAHGGAGAKFVSTAAGLTDAEYRFAMQARLNQVDTNATLKRRRLRANATCRAPNCSRAETLAHVLNHCAPNMDTIRQRHDSALEQIGAQLQHMVDRSRGSQEIRLNQTVPGYTGVALRPDIQVSNPAAKTMVIADLAITFEDQPTSQQASSSLQLSHDHKILKYQPIVAELQHKGWRVQTAAIIYGSLGSVHPSNFVTYTEKLGLLKREARRLNIQLSSHCIRASHRIWNWHCSQHRTRQQSGTASRAPRGSGGVQRSTPQAAAQ